LQLKNNKLANTYLFPAVGRQIEGEYSEHVNRNAGNDEIDAIVQSLPSDDKGESDVRVFILRATRVDDDVLLGRRHHEIPLDGLVVLLEVHRWVYGSRLVETIYDKVPLVPQINLYKYTFN